MNDPEPDPRSRTIGEAKREIEQLTERIDSLESAGITPDHVGTLREKRDELEEHIEYSQDHHRTKSAAENFVAALANSPDE